MINTNLATQRNISNEDILKLERLHVARDSLHYAIQQAYGAGSRKLVKAIADVLPMVEEELQKLWGFPVNSNYYKFWSAPMCSCAVMDNEDNYPHGYYTINNSCWLHGEEKDEQI